MLRDSDMQCQMKRGTASTATKRSGGGMPFTGEEHAYPYMASHCQVHKFGVHA